MHRSNDFWDCLSYSVLEDNLFELIMEKMSKKAGELVDILAGDLNKCRP
jgi:hypothetical protein